MFPGGVCQGDVAPGSQFGSQIESGQFGGRKPFAAAIPLIQTLSQVDKIDVLVVRALIGQLQSERTDQLARLTGLRDGVRGITDESDCDAGFFLNLTHGGIIGDFVGFDMAARG